MRRYQLPFIQVQGLTAKYCYESPRAEKLLQSKQDRGQKEKRDSEKKNFKQIDETSSKWEFPFSMLIPALTDITRTPNAAVGGIDK